MEPKFWLDKWSKQETGFHLEKPHPQLCKNLNNAFSGVENIFVPLCGKTQDMSYLAEQGKKVVGNELSEIAVKAFFDSRSIQADIYEEGTFTRYSSEGIDIWAGDFFELNNQKLANCKGIYDRAALVALPPKMRESYVQKLQGLIPSAKLLLVTLEYPQTEMDGPPFSVPESEIEQLFNFAEINKLYSQDILEKEPKFRARGLSRFVETTYLIQW